MIRPMDWLHQFGLEKFRERTVWRIKWTLVWFGSTTITEMTLPLLGEAQKILALVVRTGWKLFANTLRRTASL